MTRLRLFWSMTWGFCSLLSYTGLAFESMVFVDDGKHYLLTDPLTGDSERLSSKATKVVVSHGTVAFLEGDELYVVTDTKTGDKTRVDRNVSDVFVGAGTVAYLREDRLYVYSIVADESLDIDRDVFRVAAGDGIVAYLVEDKLYLVTDVATGRTARIASSVTNFVVDGRNVYFKRDGEAYLVTNLESGDYERFARNPGMIFTSDGRQLNL